MHSVGSNFRTYPPEWFNLESLNGSRVGKARFDEDFHI